jgi:hypothetical protein
VGASLVGASPVGGVASVAGAVASLGGGSVAGVVASGGLGPSPSLAGGAAIADATASTSESGEQATASRSIG